MQTVNFQCGHCGNLMAVGLNFLGQQVRCPHCQQVVMAPASAAPAPTPAAAPAPGPVPAFLQPTINFNKNNEEESIFAPPPPDDDLFGAPSAAPRLELPPAPPPSSPAPPVLDSTMAFEPSPPAMQPAPEPPANPDATTLLVDGAAQSAVTGPANDSTLLTADTFGTAAPAVTRVPRVQAGSGSLWWLYTLVLPLISYAILSTVLIVILWNKSATVRVDPLEAMPDVNGDTPGVRPGGGGNQRMNWLPPEEFNNIPIAPHRKVALGDTLKVGDLEIKPLKVEQKIVKVFVENAVNPEPCGNASLVLTMRLRNISSKWAFTPLDNYFDRKVRPGNPKPLTLVEFSGKRFYGGPATWYPRVRSSKRREDRQWLDGRSNFDERGLAPGEAKDTFVCTDGDDGNVVQALLDRDGPLLWRVQLRRGVVQVGKALKPATTVIGVEFTKKQIEIVDQ